MSNSQKEQHQVSKRNDTIYRIVKYAAKIVLSPLFYIKTEGLENLPYDSAYVLLPKHQKWIDIPVIANAVQRPLYYIAKHELFKNPFSKLFISLVGGIPLNRKRPIESRHSLSKMIEYLGKGEGVVIFPEGTYYVNTMGKGNSGVVKFILSRLTITFIPVGINYRKQGFRTRVVVKFGKSIHGHKRSPEELLKRVMKDIAELSDIQAS